MTLSGVVSIVGPSNSKSFGLFVVPVANLMDRYGVMILPGTTVKLLESEDEFDVHLIMGYTHEGFVLASGEIVHFRPGEECPLYAFPRRN